MNIYQFELCVVSISFGMLMTLAGLTSKFMMIDVYDSVHKNYQLVCTFSLITKFSKFYAANKGGIMTIRRSRIYANIRCTLAGTLQPPGWRPRSSSTSATTCSIEPAMKWVWIFGPFLWSQHFYRNYIFLLFFNISQELDVFLDSVNCSH